MQDRYDRKLRIRLAFVLVIPVALYFLIVNWRYLFTIKDIQNQNIGEITSICNCVAKSNCDQFGARGSCVGTVIFYLENGIKLEMYSKYSEQIFGTSNPDELSFVKDKLLSFTYVSESFFSDGGFTLLSISENGNGLLLKDDVLHSYLSSMEYASRPVFVLCCIALAILLLPIVFSARRKIMRKRKKQAKKQKYKATPHKKR